MRPQSPLHYCAGLKIKMGMIVRVPAFLVANYSPDSDKGLPGLSIQTQNIAPDLIVKSSH